MEAWLHSSIQWLLVTLALPKVGLSAIFAVSLVSATLLPLGSEPAVFAFVKAAPHMFWPAVVVATVGNTLGGMISFAMGSAAEKAYEHWRHKHETAQPQADGHVQTRAAHGGKILPRHLGGRWHIHVHYWADRLGPMTLLLSWLPVVGDPLCAVAGWLRFAFWPSVLYMAIGKFLRYVAMTSALIWIFPYI